jgi:hypothetical protein
VKRLCAKGRLSYHHGGDAMKKSTWLHAVVVLIVGLGTVGLLASPAAAAPANDNFANAITISGQSGTQAGTNLDATLQTGEPDDAASGNVTQTVWYSWTAPSGAEVNFCAFGDGDFADTTLGVYQGSAVDDLDLIRANDDGGYGMGVSSQVRFTPTNGDTYKIQVGSFDHDPPQAGTFTLYWASDCTIPSVFFTGKGVAVHGVKVIATFAASDDVSAPADILIECTFNGTDWDPCTSPEVFLRPAGSYTLRIRATDEAGNTTLFPPQRSFVVHSKKPLG